MSFRFPLFIYLKKKKKKDKIIKKIVPLANYIDNDQSGIKHLLLNSSITIFNTKITYFQFINVIYSTVLNDLIIIKLCKFYKKFKTLIFIVCV